MSSPGKILLITQVFYPDQVSTANLFTNLCINLVEKNVIVEVWCAHPSYTDRKRQTHRFVHKGILIRYLPSTNFPKRRFMGRMMNYLTFMISVIYRLMVNTEKYPVFIHTTPPSLGIVVSWICSVRHRKFIYILLDIFPDGLILLGKLSIKNPLVRLWRRMNLSTLRKSHKIIAIGRDMLGWIGRVYIDGLQKTEYIPLWQDEKLIVPLSYEENPLVMKYGLQDKFVVQYSGNMGLWNEMESIAQVVNIMHEEACFMFIGGGMREKELRNAIKEKAKRNVIFLPFQSNEQLNESLNACHVALVSMKENLKGIAVPSKLYGIMASGIPVVALVPEGSEIDFVIKEEDCGFVIQPRDVEAIVQAIRMLRGNNELRIRMGANGRQAFLQKYTTSRSAEKYIALLDVSR